MYARPISSDGSGTRPATTLGPPVQIVNNAQPTEITRSGQASNLALPQAELCERLRAGVERAASRNADSMEALRAAVCEFTAALRETGTSPEAVLISLKAVLHDQARSLIPGHPSDASVYTLHEQVSTWSIREFFREPAR